MNFVQIVQTSTGQFVWEFLYVLCAVRTRILCQDEEEQEGFCVRNPNTGVLGRVIIILRPRIICGHIYVWPVDES